MAKRMLMVATVPSMIGQFNMDNINILLEMGYTVDVAADFKDASVWTAERVEKFKTDMVDLGIECLQIDFSRNILKINKHLNSYKEILKLIKSRGYSFIHTHTAVASAIVRFAARNTGTKVIYTAHGFHFFQGAPLKKWLFYYPIEKICSYWTDVLITINKEDFSFSKKKMKAKKVVYVPGVGIDLDKFEKISVDKEAKRNDMAIPDNKVWILTVGELIKRKNHEALIRAVSKMENIYLTIAGRGKLYDYLKSLIDELNISDRVKLLGFRSDVYELCYAADIFAFPSLQEGLPVSLMEAMASGLPVACSRIRGNTDLIDEGKGGVLFDPESIDDIINALDKLLNSDIKAMALYNNEKIKEFDLINVKREMTIIYENCMN